MYVSDLKHPDPALEAKLQRLYSLGRGARLELGFRPQYLDLLKKFGNPQENIPPAIHIAGTNGKGSTLAFLRYVLEESGYKVHTYTSPHLIRFNERISLAGMPIDDEMLESLIDEALEYNVNNEISFFEITTAIAFAAFAREPADIALIEVGMGGRFDCTNVIGAPLASIITPVSYDHSEYLGNSLAAIAEEKAGIIKLKTPVIVSPQTPEALEVIKAKAQKERAPFIQADLSLSQNLTLGLSGAHQHINASAAIAALNSLKGKLSISSQHIKTGLAKTIWPARMQKLEESGGWEIWLDGGHNENAGQALAQKAQEWKDQDLHLIFTMMKHKDPTGFLAPLLPYCKSLNITELKDEPAAETAENILKHIEKLGNLPPIATHTNWQTAVESIKTTSPNGGRILICGSLYLAGNVLASILRP